MSKALVRGAKAQLDARDPEFIRKQLPLMWLLSSIYFRAEVRGLEKVPEDRPVLFVGNHSGGNMSPDTMVFILAFSTYFGVERPIHALAHALVTAWPGVGLFLKKWGVITADPENARAALYRGACVLVYPGGDIDTHRPWTARHKIRFDGRKGFLRLAREAGVEIVPIVADGGQETYFPLTDGRRLASILRLDKLARLKVMPISLALPWGLNVGDFMGHLPLPAKLRLSILDPIDIKQRFGAEPGWEDRAYEYIEGVMQAELSLLAAEHRLGAMPKNPIRRTVFVHRPPSTVFALLTDFKNYPQFFVGIQRWETLSDESFGIGTRVRVLMHAGAIAAGGVICVNEIARNERIGWHSESGIKQDGCWELRAIDGGTELTLEIGIHLAGGVSGKIVEYVAGRSLARYMEATLLTVQRLLESEIVQGVLEEESTGAVDEDIP